MKEGRLYFLFLVLALSLVLVYFIIKPFLGALILASVFSFIFQPIYKALAGSFGNRYSLASFTTTIIAIVLIIIPLTFVGTQILHESSDLYNSLSEGDQNGFVVLIEDSLTNLRSAFPMLNNISIDFGNYARKGVEAVIQNFGVIFSSFAKILLNVFVFIVAFYFLLKDGYKLKDYFIALSPLPDTDDELVVSRLKLAVSATVKGNLAIGIIQGCLTGVGLTIFGVPNPILWGCVAAISALIPGIGTALVLAPAIIFLFFTGSTFGAVGLIIWGVVAVGMIDNIVGPKLVGKGMHLHPLAVFLSVLGGLSFFGPLGFLLGPLTMSVCLALIDIYFALKKV